MWDRWKRQLPWFTASTLLAYSTLPVERCRADHGTHPQGSPLSQKPELKLSLYQGMESGMAPIQLLLMKYHRTKLLR